MVQFAFDMHVMRCMYYSLASVRYSTGYAEDVKRPVSVISVASTIAVHIRLRHSVGSDQSQVKGGVGVTGVLKREADRRHRMSVPHIIVSALKAATSCTPFCLFKEVSHML